MQSVRAFPELDGLWQQLVTVRYVHFVAEDMAHAADARTLSRFPRQPLFPFDHGITEADPGRRLPKS